MGKSAANQSKESEKGCDDLEYLSSLKWAGNKDDSDCSPYTDCDDDNNQNLWWIALIVIGVIVLLLLAWWIWRTYMKKKSVPESTGNPLEDIRKTSSYGTKTVLSI